MIHQRMRQNETKFVGYQMKWIQIHESTESTMDSSELL